MSKLRTLFISIKMSGEDDSEVWQKMKKYQKALEDIYDEKFILIDNLHKEEGMNRPKMLGDSIMLMADADLIFFAPNWNNSPGCKIEFRIACTYMLEKIIPWKVRASIIDPKELTQNEMVDWTDIWMNP